MNMTEIKEIAKTHQIKVNGVTKGDLIRSIQRVEGNLDCFASDHNASCGQDLCLWRKDCIEATKK